MNRTAIAIIAAALVLAVGGFAAIAFVGGGGEEPSPAASEPDPGALPGGPSDEPTDAADPFDFDASELDPEYVWEDADIHLACGQLLGEAQIAAFLNDPIDAAELEVAEDLGGGFAVVCDFTSDLINGNTVRVDYIGAGETITGCLEGEAEHFYEPDPAGPGASYYDIDGGSGGFYRACLTNARLDLTAYTDIEAGGRPPTVDDYRALAAYFAANQDKFALALRAA